MLADCEFTCNKNSASLTFHFGHHKGIAGFIFTIKDTIVLINKNKWFSGKFRIAQSVNHKNGEMCCISVASANVISTYLWKLGQAQISTWMTQCHFLWLWQRMETCPSLWCRPVLPCCQWHQNGSQLCKYLIAETIKKKKKNEQLNYEYKLLHDARCLLLARLTTS